MPDTLHPIQQLSAEGPWGGPTYLYRGAKIRCCPGGNVCGLAMRVHRMNGVTFGAIGTVTPLVDAWLDENRMPRYIQPTKADERL